jgi:hypothetical protein
MWPFTPKPPGQDENERLIRAAKQELRARRRGDAAATPEATSVPPGAESEPGVLELFTGYNGERLGMPLAVRVPLLMVSSFGAGFLIGAGHGGPKAGDRYRAENAHRLPTTRNGWYLYHKSKNYHAIIGGVTSGVKLGAVLTGWATLFMATEEVVDRARERLFARQGPDGEVLATGQRDAASTVVAAMSTAGIYSWRRGLDYFTAARTAKMTLKTSLVFGLFQDALSSMRGSRPSYVDRVIRVVTGRHQEQAEGGGRLTG